VLVMPYRYRGELVAIRLRNLAAKTNTRFWTPGLAAPSAPFNADALDAASGGEIHLVADELEACTLSSYGPLAVSVSGIGALSERWIPLLAGMHLLVVWYRDDDTAGGYQAGLHRALEGRLGAEWVRTHARAVAVPHAPSGAPLAIQGAQRRGMLADVASQAPWRS
jgi:hypothetical protein